MNMKKFSAFALAGLMGLSLASIPAQAADGSGDTDVVYTIGSTMSNNLVMIMPANMEMFPDKLTSDERTLSIRNLDSTIDLVNAPQTKGGGVIYNIEVSSKYGSKFLVDDGTTQTETTDVGYNLMVNRPNWLTLDGNRTDVNLSATDATGGLRENMKAAVESTPEKDRQKYDNKQGDDAGIPAFEYKFKSEMVVKEGNNWVKVDDANADTKAKRLKKVESLGKNGTTLTDTLTFKLSNVAWK